MVGILSLFGYSTGHGYATDNRQTRSIPEDMSQALLTRDGRLGQELKLVEANEKGK